MKRSLVLILLITLFLASNAQVTRNYTVIMRSNSQSVNMWDGTIMPIYGFASLLSEKPPIPAKTLYCNEGDTVVIKARMISQGHHHTIHLHGLDVDTRNDGDPATSFQLSHGQDTTYTFIAKHAGTYLYHCHVGDVVHVQMGMYGLIVVRAAGGVKTAWTGGPAYDKEYSWLTSEMDKAWHLNVPLEDTINHIINIPPYRPDYFLINGKSETELPLNDSIHIRAQQGEVVYLRVANIGFLDNRIIFPAAINAKIVDSDGRPLPSEIVIDTLIVSPGERYGILMQGSSQMQDTIHVEYINMNNYQIASTQHVPVTISGYIGLRNESKEKLLEIYPNPADNYIELNWNGGNAQLKICDLLGHAMLQKQIASGTEHIDISEIPAGMYFISVQDGQGSVAKKILINR